MSVTTSVSTVTTAAQIAASQPGRRLLILQNTHSSGTAYIGGSAVTSANGIRMVPGDIIHIKAGYHGDFSPADAWYAVSDSNATATVRVASVA